jgi:hypothetical protein
MYWSIVKNIVIVDKQVLLEECIPSIRNNIWCYPTSRVLSISCVEYILCE